MAFQGRTPNEGVWRYQHNNFVISFFFNLKQNKNPKAQKTKFFVKANYDTMDLKVSKYTFGGGESKYNTGDDKTIVIFKINI